jgi:hypothetical protein
MTFQERPYDDLERHDTQQPAAGGSQGRDLDQVRREGEALLRAGDEAIRRGLSGDSERFLTASRQQGGQ